MQFLPTEIDEYAAKHSSPEEDLLYRLNRETHLKMTLPQMLSGHMQGKILKMFSQMIRPTNILEIGTFTGYSALCLAQGLREGGVLHTIDVNEELQEIINRYIKEAGMESKIRLHIGPAVNILPTLKTTFDLVFIDADKENYSRYFDLVFPMVNTGGFIIADNVLWSGKVLDSDSKMDIDTRSLKEYSRKIQDDPRVENVLFPVRDGLMIARKK